MARIRSIKPEFPQSESMGRISRDARLLFIQMWTIADDSGRLRGNSRMLASLLFPYDEDARGLISTWMEELENEKCIVCYKGPDGGSYVAISNWQNHQKIDKPSKSKLPEPPSRILASPRECSSNPRELSLEDLRIKDQGEEGRGGDAKGVEKEPPSLSRHLALKEFQEVWAQWKMKLSINNGRPVDPITEQSQLYELEGYSSEAAISIVRYSTSRTKCNNLITNGDHAKAAAPPKKVGPPPEKSFEPKSRKLLELAKQEASKNAS